MFDFSRHRYTGGERVNNIIQLLLLHFIRGKIFFILFILISNISKIYCIRTRYISCIYVYQIIRHVYFYVRTTGNCVERHKVLFKILILKIRFCPFFTIIHSYFYSFTNLFYKKDMYVKSTLKVSLFVSFCYYFTI